MKHDNSLPSNSKYAYIGFAICILSFAAGYLLDRNGHLRVGMVVGFLGFGIAWALCVVAQLITGYAWQNSVAGNRGPHKDENPKRYWLAFFLSLFVALLSCFMGISQLYKE